MKTEILIVGGGLSGLRLAANLNQRGVDWQLVEARNRLGGRVLTETVNGFGYDLGPAWFWPGQSRMASLIDRFDLSYFEQAHDGTSLFQDEVGVVHHMHGVASMQGSLRLHGGMGVLINRLAEGLPSERLHGNSPIIKLTQTSLSSGDIRILAETDKEFEIQAKHVVLAIPPRLVSPLKFNPQLPESVCGVVEGIPTWMGGHAKFIAIYSQHFWRLNGFSGDAFSRSGPLVEIHDASPAQSDAGALFGFVGTPPQLRLDEGDSLKQAAVRQLGELFGTDALDPIQVRLKDWAFDECTATQRDHTPLQHHPNYGLPEILENVWDGRLHFGSSEMGTVFGGFLEGALEVADDLADRLVP